MRRPPYHREERERLDVKMTPMIDVIFLLLIFFVCTASFQMLEEVLPTKLSLPGSVSAQTPPEQEFEDLDEMVVEVFWREEQPAWRINGRDYTRLRDVGAVMASVAKVKIDLPVILDVESKVPLEHVIDVYDLCRSVGLEKIQFAAPVGSANDS
ncbi:MAG: biopolymer transporter ExbD [Pirellulales bacterium]|nr:biopolymer transporter ExbD [Pirellulales bacterium]